MNAYQDLRAMIQETRPDLDLDLLDRTYALAEKAHAGQKRYSGEPYINHPLEVARILLELNPDLLTLQTALLHDTTEDTELTAEQIAEHFGTELADLVVGMEKLSVVKVPNGSEKQELWKRMFLSMAKDLRILFVKLADRLHNLRTLEYVPKQKQSRIAEESLAVHASISSRLGIYQFKSEIEDLCFKYLEPEVYDRLFNELEEKKARSTVLMARVEEELAALLQEANIPFLYVESRFKHLYSLYQKMQRKQGQDLSEIYDLFAVRILLPDSLEGSSFGSLYQVLGLLHQRYLPLQDRFKDYLAVPKPNGYRSLHTTVLGLGGEDQDNPVEIQIRTLQIHKEAELGIASHHQYKMGVQNSAVDLKRYQEGQEILGQIEVLTKKYPQHQEDISKWIHQYQQMPLEERKFSEDLLLKLGVTAADLQLLRRARALGPLRYTGSLDQNLAILKGLAEQTDSNTELNLYPHQIFILTPKRDVLELPKGATPLDFAYNIHTDLGHHAAFAKVNGRIVPLDYELQNGDLVEVGTRSNITPRRFWLSFLKTTGARSKVKSWLNKEDKELHIKRGRELLNAQLLTHGKAALDEKLSLLKEYLGVERSFSEREEILEALGMGTLSPVALFKSLFQEYQNVSADSSSEATEKSQSFVSEVLITGEANLPVALSACCQPRPPDPIIGFVTRGQSIRVHLTSCPELSGLDGTRFVSAHWKPVNKTSKS